VLIFVIVGLYQTNLILFVIFYMRKCSYFKAENSHQKNCVYLVSTAVKKYLEYQKIYCILYKKLFYKIQFHHNSVSVLHTWNWHTSSPASPSSEPYLAENARVTWRNKQHLKILFRYMQLMHFFIREIYNIVCVCHITFCLIQFSHWMTSKTMPFFT
jgi:hypothetical protein